jgi:ParB family chromosome partitioning protein
LSHLFGEAEAAYRPDSPAPSDAAADLPSTPPRTLPVAFLQPGRFQPRRHFEPEALAELASSIKTHGLLQPILVRPLEDQAERYEIVAGERRWRAAQQAGLHDVPVVIQTLTDSQSLEIGLIENLQRQDLTALEEAEGYRRLMDEFSHSHAELGELIGKSRSHVANMLRLLGLPDRVKTMVQEGALSAGHARALLTAPDPIGLAETVVARGLSVRETERLAGAVKATPEKAAAAGPAGRGGSSGGGKHADLVALERDLTERLGLKVTIESRGQAGTLAIAYRSLDQLDDVLERLGRAS